MSFSELGLSSELLRGIEALGFTEPTEIQKQVIPVALNADLDLMALAQTGTGKTAGFGLPLLHNLDPGHSGIQGLVLCPTRELCMQVASDLENFSRFCKKAKVVPVYGGASIVKQIKDIRAGAQIIVATPGRLIDLLRRNELNLDSLRVVIMDEADEMLNMGFREDLEVILGVLPENHATWLFSATMPSEIQTIAQKFMKNPVVIGRAAANMPNANIEHNYFLCRADERYETLKRVLDANPGIFGLIFCQTKVEVQQLSEDLTKDGYNVDALHGDLSQADRDRVMGRFRGGRLDLLIATDVAARGIDVSDISHVINYGFPYDYEAYTHRTGRTGRAGRSGKAFSIVTKKFEPLIQRAERTIKTSITRLPIPTNAEIFEKQLQNFTKKIKEAASQAPGELGTLNSAMMAELEDITKEQLLQYLATRELGELLAFYKGRRDPMAERSSSSMSNSAIGGAGSTMRRAGGNTGDSVRIFVNLGRIDGFDAMQLAESILGNVGLPAEAIINVDLNKNFSHLDAHPRHAESIMRSLDGSTIEGRTIRANIAERIQTGGGGRDSRPPFRGGRPERNDRPARPWTAEPPRKKPFGGGGASAGGYKKKRNDFSFS